jgi:ectoine hydroxylase-related dioxygenase (phytanoyl-CoA dioxygenase family)
MSVISKEHIKFYQDYGFVKVDNILDEREITELSEFIEEAMTEQTTHSTQTDSKDGSYYRVLNQRVNVWRDHGGMARYTFHPRISEAALQLSGALGIRLFHDHALWKMPEDSKPTPWHQDFPYWPMQQTGALSAWIPLDDVDEENGCMMFVPGSHKIGKLKGIDLKGSQNIFDQIKGTELEKTKPVKVPLKKGSCTFHDGLTFHYANANQTDKPRRVLALIFMPDGTEYNGKAHIVTDHKGLTKDQPFQGGLFPLIASKS